MMKIEIRDDVILVEGYVNAVERYSKVLHDANGAFIEKMEAGVFQRALDRARRTGREVKVLLNHDYTRELTSTKDATTKLWEDAVGLRCRCEIRDKETIELAKKKKLVGWSFGFACLKADRKKVEDISHRDVREIDLREVSILDDSKIPAYDGNSIETRSETMEEFVEFRMLNDNVEFEDHTKKEKPADNSSWERRYLATRAF